MTRKRFILLILMMIAAGIGGIAWTLPNYAAKKILSSLNQTGFKEARVGSIHIIPEGIVAQNISLDAHGLDRIDAILIAMDWPARSVKKVDILRPSLSLLLKRRSLFGLAASFHLPALPAVPIGFRYITLDLSTDVGIFRVSGDVFLSPAPGGNAKDHLIQGHLSSRQYAVGFDTSWTGRVTQNGAIHLSAAVEEAQIKTPGLQVNRANGWMSVSLAAGALSVATEIDSGSGKISGLPVQDMRLAARAEKDHVSITARSYFSGEKNTRLSIDVESDAALSVGQAVLQIGTPDSFLNKLQDSGTIPPPPTSLTSLPPVTLRLALQPERRFEGGPLPFELTLADTDTKYLNGNILFYGDESVWRGNIQGTPDLIQDIARWLSVPDGFYGPGFLRIEKNSGAWLPAIR